MSVTASAKELPPDAYTPLEPWKAYQPVARPRRRCPS
jgi:hypothetical protein